MLTTIEQILSVREPAQGNIVGRSREDRPIASFRFGRGETKISLIAGCHADEPTGPALLRRLAAYLAGLPIEAEALQQYQWWIVPDVNPDGAVRNHAWAQTASGSYNLAAYLLQVVREMPGDDVEFGFPFAPDDSGARPENRSVYDWWRSDPTPFALHVSLHGMAFAAGPWFLIDPDWRDRCDVVKRRCRDETRRLGYALHDVERNGEKGFERIERGFCTRPNSVAMKDYFLARGDRRTAAKFRPSSMETIRSFGGDPLTLVSEVPLFVTPGVGERIVPRDPAAEAWRGRIAAWQTALRGTADPRETTNEIDGSGIVAVPVEDQMRLQWALVTAGIEQIRVDG